MIIKIKYVLNNATIYKIILSLILQGHAFYDAIFFNNFVGLVEIGLWPDVARRPPVVLSYSRACSFEDYRYNSGQSYLHYSE
jgi:hypothetical protein